MHRKPRGRNANERKIGTPTTVEKFDFEVVHLADLKCQPADQLQPANLTALIAIILIGEDQDYIHIVIYLCIT